MYSTYMYTRPYTACLDLYDDDDDDMQMLKIVYLNYKIYKLYIKADLYEAELKVQKLYWK